jgi:uncharacterized Tic20 family protein
VIEASDSARSFEGGRQVTNAASVVITPEERGLAVATHLSGLAGYIVPLGGVLVPILIWMVKSDSRVISSIAKQALLLNVVVFFACLVLILPALTVILLPIVIPIWIALGLAAIALPIVGAIRASDGIYYTYPVVGFRP